MFALSAHSCILCLDSFGIVETTKTKQYVRYAQRIRLITKSNRIKQLDEVQVWTNSTLLDRQSVVGTRFAEGIECTVRIGRRSKAVSIPSSGAEMTKPKVEGKCAY